MRNNTTAFNNAMKSPVRTIKSKVEHYNGSTLVNTYYDTDIIQSWEITRVAENNRFFGQAVVGRLNLKTINDVGIIAGDKLIVYLGYDTTLITEYEYTVTEVHKNENKGIISITAYDAIYFLKNHTFDDLKLTAPYTISKVANAICAISSDGAFTTYTTSNLGSDKTAFDYNYPNGANFEGTEDLRTVLHQICEFTQSICCAIGGGRLSFRRTLPTATAVYTVEQNDIITLDTKTNRRLVGICSANELGDNIEAKLAETGTTQYIRNNGFLDMLQGTEQARLMKKALALIGGLTFPQFTCKWRGHAGLSIGDCVNFEKADGTNLKAYLMDETLKFDGGYTHISKFDFEEDEDSETNPSTLGEALNRTYARVDKVNKQIDLVVSDVQSNTEQITGINENLENVTERVTTAENKVASLEIDTNGIKGTVSDLETTTTTITTTVNDLQNQIDNVEVGGRNLARNTATAVTTQPVGSNTWGNPAGIFPISDFGKQLLLDTNNTNFTIQFDWESAGFDTAVTMYLSFRYTANSYSAVGAKFNVPVGNSSGSVKHTFTPTDAQRTYGLGWLVSGFGANNRNATITISKLKLEIGNKATTWTVAPEDIENDISKLQTDLETTTTTVTNTVEKVGTLETTTDSIIGRISNVETTTTQNTGAIGNLQTYVDQLEVGGRNLLLDTNAPSLTKVSAKNNRYFSNPSASNIVPTYIELTDAPVNIQYGANFVVNATGTNGRLLGWYSSGKVKLNQGDSYTMSCYARVTDGSKMALRFIYGNEPWNTLTNIEVSSKEWKRYSFTFTYDGEHYGDTNNLGTTIYMGAGSTYLGTLQCCGFKLEKGTQATDWIPAPEDVDYNVYIAKNTADLATETITEVTERVATLETNQNGISATVSSHTTTISSLQDASSSQADNITALRNAMNSIGTRNYIINTLIPDVSTSANCPKLVGQTSNTACQTGAKTTVAEHGFRTTCETATRPLILFGSYLASSGTLNGLEAGETYTLSFDTTFKFLSGTIDNSNDYYYRAYLYTDTTTTGTFNLTAYYTIKTITPAIRGSQLEGRCEFTFTVPDNVTMAYISISSNVSNDNYYRIGDFIEIRKVQLEKGSVATDYTPAPEDYQKAITSAEQALSNDIASTQTSLGNLTGNISDLTNDLDGVKDNINKTTDKLTKSINDLKKEVNLRMTDEEFDIAISEKLSNGVKSVETETGYKFDKDGLTIAKSDSDISTFIDNTGMTVKNSFEDVLTATAGGVDAVNLTARNFLIIGTRCLITDYGDDQVGIFYIGS